MGEAIYNQSVVMMPPYVEPKHRQLIEKAESMLEEFERELLSQIKVKLFDSGWNISPSPSDIMEAERRYHEDPMRMHLVMHLANIKALCERPRFMIKAVLPEVESKLPPNDTKE